MFESNQDVYDKLVSYTDELEDKTVVVNALKLIEYIGVKNFINLDDMILSNETITFIWKPDEETKMVINVTQKGMSTYITYSTGETDTETNIDVNKTQSNKFKKILDMYI